MSKNARKYVGDLSGDLFIEVFKEEELLVYIKIHVLVPEHKVLTDDVKKDLLKKFNIKQSSLFILKSLIQFLNFLGQT